MRVRFQAGACASPPAADHKPASASSCGVRWRHRAVVAAVLLALAGCASVSQKQGLAWKVEPVLDVKHGAQSSEAYYTLGRYYDGSQGWDKAVDAYRKAIAADTRNMEAYNALGVALARSHRLEEAEAILRNAVGIDPNSAHVRSNLGLVLLLAGRPQEAVSVLQASLTLDRENVTARANLHEAMAQWKTQQANREGDVTAAESNPRSSVVEATAFASPAAATAVEAMVSPSTPNHVPAPTVATAAPLPAEMRLTDHPTVPAFLTGVMSDSSSLPTKATEPMVAAAVLAPRPVSTAASSTLSVRLELSNGNGIKGAAARLKHWLTAEGLQVERLTNRRPYDQQRTVIHYRSGQQEAALRVAQALRMTAQIDATPSTDLRSDVRVVLGQDWVRTAACLERNACEGSSIVAAVLRP
jgi:tetratricopeptide (TPR) repeat protein